jgi:hypothetical protein
MASLGTLTGKIQLDFSEFDRALAIRKRRVAQLNRQLNRIGWWGRFIYWLTRGGT